MYCLESADCLLIVLFKIRDLRYIPQPFRVSELAPWVEASALGAMPLWSADFKLWQKHTPEEWQQWVLGLREEGGGSSHTEWRDWVNLMLALQKSIDEIPDEIPAQERKRAAQPLPQPHRNAPAHQTWPPPKEETPAQGPPAQGRASSASSEQSVNTVASSPSNALASMPVQGPPAQGRASSSSATYGGCTSAC